jgi:hypothetical protein
MTLGAAARLVALVYAIALGDVIPNTRLTDQPLAAAVAVVALGVAVWAFRAVVGGATDVENGATVAALAILPLVLGVPLELAVPAVFFPDYAGAFSLGAFALAVAASIGTAGAIVWLLRSRSSGPADVWVLLPFALLGRIAMMWAYPLSPRISDMLPAIRAAAERQLAGTVPYGRLDLGTHTPLLSYLPGTWLPFVPLVWAGLDLRLLGLVATLVVAIAMTRTARGGARLVLPVVGAFLFSPTLVSNHPFLYTGAIWVLIAAVALALVATRSLGVAILLGLGLATQQLTVLIGPPLFGYLCRRHGFPRAVALIGAAAVAAAIVVAPFLLAAPEPFVAGVWSQYRRDDLVPFVTTRVVGLGATPLLAIVGLADLTFPLQVIATSAVGLGGLWRAGNPAEVLAWAGLTTAVFLFFNYPSWGYLWMQAWLLLAFALLLRAHQSPKIS